MTVYEPIDATLLHIRSAQLNRIEQRGRTEEENNPTKESLHTLFALVFYYFMRQTRTKFVLCY